MLHIPPTNSLFLTAKQELCKKAYLSTKNIEEFSGKKFRRKGQQAEKDMTERVTDRTRQKNKGGDSKVESNDSPEIPDREKTSDIPGLPSGWRERDRQTDTQTHRQTHRQTETNTERERETETETERERERQTD